MNLKRYKDSIKKDKTIVFHSTASKQELAEILLEKKFRPGRGGGKMLGGGFYANQHLYQAKKNNYGRNILKAQVYGIERFLILDKDIFEELFGASEENFIWKQLENKVRNKNKWGEWLTETWLNKAIKRSNSSAQIAVELWDNFGKELQKHFYGFEYSGNWDKESIVCWFPEKCIKPLEVSFDNAESWIPVKEAKEFLETQDKNQNLHKSEAVRSAQRAHDLISRYEGKSDDQLTKAIQTQLSKIVDIAKKAQRREAFVTALSELRPDMEIKF